MKTKKIQNCLKNLDSSYKGISTQFIAEWLYDNGELEDKFEKIENCERVIRTLGREKTEKLWEQKAEAWNKARSSVRYHLKKLVEKGILEKKQDGRRNLYLLNA